MIKYGFTIILKFFFELRYVSLRYNKYETFHCLLMNECLFLMLFSTDVCLPCCKFKLQLTSTKVFFSFKKWWNLFFVIFVETNYIWELSSETILHNLWHFYVLFVWHHKLFPNEIIPNVIFPKNFGKNFRDYFCALNGSIGILSLLNPTFRPGSPNLLPFPLT